MNKKTMLMTTKTITYCAMLAAISVALARLAGLMPNEFTRFSIEAVPIFLAGLFFGPVAGGCVGFAAEFVGCMFSPYGYIPIYCIPPSCTASVPVCSAIGSPGMPLPSGSVPAMFLQWRWEPF